MSLVTAHIRYHTTALNRAVVLPYATTLANCHSLAAMISGALATDLGLAECSAAGQMLGHLYLDVPVTLCREVRKGMVRMVSWCY